MNWLLIPIRPSLHSTATHAPTQLHLQQRYPSQSSFPGSIQIPSLWCFHYYPPTQSLQLHPTLLLLHLSQTMLDWTNYPTHRCYLRSPIHLHQRLSDLVQTKFLRLNRQSRDFAMLMFRY